MSTTKKPASLNSRWTSSDDTLLRELISKGCNATQISDILGRTRSAIFGRKIVLGIPGKIKRTGKGKASPLAWGTKTKRSQSTPEVTTSPMEVSTETHPTVSKGEKPMFLNLRWSDSDDNSLRELVKAGRTASEISEILGRTRNAIMVRKSALGIEEKLKRSERGKSAPLTWGTKSKHKTGESSEVPSLFPTEDAPAVKETSVESKSKANKVPYNVKLAQTNQRRRRGDIRKVAKMTGFSEGFVSTVVNGLQVNEKIMSVFYNMVRGRKTNESMMKK